MPLPRAVPVTLAAAERTTLKTRLRREDAAPGPAAGPDRAGGGPRPGQCRIAADLGITVDTVRKWRGRFAARSLDGLRDLPARGGRGGSVS